MIEKSINFRISFSGDCCNVDSESRCDSLMDIDVDDPAYNCVICRLYASFLDYTNTYGFKAPSRCDFCISENGAN
jgi:hypothetical protein